MSASTSTLASASTLTMNDQFLYLIQEKLNKLEAKNETELNEYKRVKEEQAKQLHELANKLATLDIENKKAHEKIASLEVEKKETDQKVVLLEQKIDQSDSIPVGTVLIWTTGEIPKKYFVCDGRSLQRKGEHAALFDVIGTHYGQGDNIRTFNIPNYTGRFIVCADNEDVVGSVGDATNLSHSHTGQVSISCDTSAAGAHSHTIVNKNGTPSCIRWTGGSGTTHSLIDAFGTKNKDRVYTDTAGDHAHSVNTTAHFITDDSGEVQKLRPKWASALYIIKVIP